MPDGRGALSNAHLLCNWIPFFFSADFGYIVTVGGIAEFITSELNVHQIHLFFQRFELWIFHSLMICITIDADMFAGFYDLMTLAIELQPFVLEGVIEFVWFL
jgi:hypothetical protein